MKRGSPVRVVVGEDQPLFQAGLVHVLSEAGLAVVAVADTAPDLVRETRAHQPDIVLIGLKMPPGRDDQGLRAAREIRGADPTMPILLLRRPVEDDYPLDLLADHATGVGYLVKDEILSATSFIAAVRGVAAGDSVVDPAVVDRLISRRRKRDPLEELTPREREVLALMAEGRSNQGIADALVVTLSAVERHVTRIFAKLALPHESSDHRRVLAVLLYLQC
jgi:DNA-binding NarL/FixJ family response regulator